MTQINPYELTDELLLTRIPTQSIIISTGKEFPRIIIIIINNLIMITSRSLGLLSLRHGSPW